MSEQVHKKPKLEEENEEVKEEIKNEQIGEINDEKNENNNGEEEKNEPGNEGNEKGERFQKKKIALVMGYSGAGYQGMQINPGAKTIEGDLWSAVVAAGGVSEMNAIDHKKVHLMRSARTDKGVHALGQIVSMKLLMKPNIIELINQNLPDQIRIFGFYKTPSTFHAKNSCDSRIYEYFIPTFMFRKMTIPKRVFEGLVPDIPPEPETKEQKMEKKKAKKPSSDSEEEKSDDEKETTKIVIHDSPEKLKERKDFRISKEELQKVNEILALYLGTKNYHNFTSGKKADDMSAKRYIISFQAGEPKIFDDMEWVSLKIHGQSFMLHQIRKMIGLVVTMMRYGIDPSILPKTFEKEKKHIPIAPGIGLFLHRVVFDGYNAKQTRNKGLLLDFKNEIPQMERFKEEQILPTILEIERTKKAFFSWVQTLDEVPERFAYLFEGIEKKE